MLFPVEDKEWWAEKYNIKPQTGVCQKCGNSIEIDVPFADGEIRGFISKNDGCGEAYRQAYYNINLNDFGEFGVDMGTIKDILDDLITEFIKDPED